MPIGGDLGFAYAVVVVVVMVIVFEVCRRWQRSVARGEEIRRLVAKVAEEEEAARARFEESVYVGFAPERKRFDERPVEIDTRPIRIDTGLVESDSRPVGYECALCLAPATMRCARCKGVRYCSGKCQILHWREGHKNECRPFNTPSQFNDVGGGSSQKVSLQQEGSERHISSSESEGSRSAKSVEKSEPNPPRLDFCENNDNDTECLANVEERGITSDGTVERNGHHLNDDHITCSDKPNQIKPSRTNHKACYGSKVSSSWNVDGTPELSISDPYIPFSGFWEGTINSSLTKVDSNDDFDQPSSSFKIHNKSDPSTGVTGSDDMTVNLGTANSANIGTKNPMEVNIQSDEECECGLSCSEKSIGIHMCNTNDIIGSASKETSRAERSSISTHHPNRSNMKPPSPQKANTIVNGTRIIVDPMISKKEEILSSASVVNLRSMSVSRFGQLAKTGKDDSVHASDATSFEFPSSLSNSKNDFKTSMRKVVDHLRVSKSPRQSGIESEITGKHIEKGLFPYEFFVKLYHWKKVEQLQPFGLLNCGNSCYANAVIQCLACTPPLTAYLLQGLHSKACKLKEWCFTCEFQSLMLRSKAGNSPLSPAAILSHIHKIKSHFGDGKEEDAHEFLRYIIDAMQSACLNEVGLRESGSLEEETTLIGLTFGGYLRSKIKCMKCGAKSEQHERLMDLTVGIEGDVGTLEEALRKFTSTEILDGENKYQCSRCRSYERAKKKFRVLEAPNVLAITLKRFQTGKFGKLNKYIRFPEVLDLAPFMSGTSDKSPIYRLYGVIVHLDSMNATYSGHYVCYVKNAENKWFEIDDSRVKSVDLQTVVANRAYMLLYARCSPRAPKLIKNLIIRDFKKSKDPPFELRSHSIGSWNVPSTDPLYDYRYGIESFHPSDTNFRSVQTVFEEDSWSENASSIFSEECSYSTESSNRDYSSTDDRFDSIFGNFKNERISSCRNSSDSESPSPSSSSCDSLSPFYSTVKSSVQLDSDSTKHLKKVGGGISSCRETHPSRLGWANPFGNKKSGLLFRRSVRERTS